MAALNLTLILKIEDTSEQAFSLSLTHNREVLIAHSDGCLGGLLKRRGNKIPQIYRRCANLFSTAAHYSSGDSLFLK